MYQKKNVGEDQNQYVALASRISGNDLGFITLLEAENGLWDPKRIGVTNDRGYCQISPYYHPKITNDPRFYDPEWQMQKCYELYKGGTVFHGKKNAHKQVNKFYLTTIQ